MARATTSLPVPLSPVNNTGSRLHAALPIRRRTSSICGDMPTKPQAFPGTFIPGRPLGIQSDDEGISLTDFPTNPLGQRIGGLLGEFRSYQHPPDTGIALTKHQPRRPVANRHPGAGTLGVGALAE